MCIRRTSFAASSDEQCFSVGHTLGGSDLSDEPISLMGICSHIKICVVTFSICLHLSFLSRINHSLGLSTPSSCSFSSCLFSSCLCFILVDIFFCFFCRSLSSSLVNSCVQKQVLDTFTQVCQGELSEKRNLMLTREEELVEFVWGETASAKRREETWYGGQHQITVQDWPACRIITLQHRISPAEN